MQLVTVCNSLLTTKFLCSPLYMNSVSITLSSVSSNSSTHTFTISSCVATTSIVVTVVKEWLWVDLGVVDTCQSATFITNLSHWFNIEPTSSMSDIIADLLYSFKQTKYFKRERSSTMSSPTHENHKPITISLYSCSSSTVTCDGFTTVHASIQL